VFIGGIGNARWGGAAMAPIPRSAGILREATEAVFWGFDSGRVTIQDNSGILSGGQTGSVQPDTTGGLDLFAGEFMSRD
jgi:hypothetical protein